MVTTLFCSRTLITVFYLSGSVFHRCHIYFGYALYACERLLFSNVVFVSSATVFANESVEVGNDDHWSAHF